MEAVGSPSFDALASAWPWRPILGCPGRYVLSGRAAPAVLAGAAVWGAFRVSGARDEVHIAAIEGGGLISYRKADGTFVHTLGTPDGFARKLAQLGINMPAGAEPAEGA